MVTEKIREKERGMEMESIIKIFTFTRSIFYSGNVAGKKIEAEYAHIGFYIFLTVMSHERDITVLYQLDFNFCL